MAKKRKPFGGRKFKKGKIVIDVTGKSPTQVTGEVWRQAKKKHLW